MTPFARMLANARLVESRSMWRSHLGTHVHPPHAMATFALFDHHFASTLNDS